MKNKIQKGFTLIELLIVIAIIGILASVVLVSLSSARTKARIANFKSQVASLQAKAVIECDGSSNTTLPAMSAQTGYQAPTITANNCGPTGMGTFTFTVTNDASVGQACTATVNQSGVTFNGC